MESAVLAFITALLGEMPQLITAVKDIIAGIENKPVDNSPITAGVVKDMQPDFDKLKTLKP